jgi:hypothetical protein
VTPGVCISAGGTLHANCLTCLDGLRHQNVAHVRVGLRWIVFVRVSSPQNGPVHGSASPRRLSCVHVTSFLDVSSYLGTVQCTQYPLHEPKKITMAISGE